MKKFFGEFKDFALRGNVMDLAVGVIIGAAFGTIVTALTDNILSPLIGLVAGHNFDALSVTFLGVTLQYGAFITAIINFVITAFVVFLLVRGLNLLTKRGKKEPEAAPTTKQCPYCCTDIPLAATRCPNCTAQLPAAEQPAKA